MKAVIVVEPAFLREVEDDDKVELVIPGGTVEDVVAMKKRLVSLLEDEREDVVTTFSFPGSPKVEVVGAEKVRDVVSSLARLHRCRVCGAVRVEDVASA